MPLPASGQISLNQIRNEFGGGTGQINLRAFYRGGGKVSTDAFVHNNTVPSSGQISLKNFNATTNGNDFRTIDSTQNVFLPANTVRAQIFLQGAGGGGASDAYYFNPPYWKSTGAAGGGGGAYRDTTVFGLNNTIQYFYVVVGAGGGGANRPPNDLFGNAVAGNGGASQVQIVTNGVVTAIYQAGGGGGGRWNTYYSWGATGGFGGGGFDGAAGGTKANGTAGGGGGLVNQDGTYPPLGSPSPNTRAYGAGYENPRSTGVPGSISIGYGYGGQAYAQGNSWGGSYTQSIVAASGQQGRVRVRF